MNPASNFFDEEKTVLQNLAHPDGFYGDIIGSCLTDVFDAVNQWTIDLMAVQPEENILEIGYGPGSAIEKLVNQTQANRIVGVDYSESMFQKASSLNANSIKSGRVHLLKADISSLPAFVERFDKVMAINSYMYWPEKRRVAILKHIRQQMTPGGQIFISLYRVYEKFESGAYHSQIQEIIANLQEAGFTGIQGISQTPQNKEAAKAAGISIGVALTGLNPAFSK